MSAIERDTRGGSIVLYETAREGMDDCAFCAGDRTADGQAPIGLTVEVHTGEGAGRGLKTAICGDCLTRALAVQMGAAHVEGGGDVGDLRVT